MLVALAVRVGKQTDLTPRTEEVGDGDCIDTLPNDHQVKHGQIVDNLKHLLMIRLRLQQVQTKHERWNFRQECSSRFKTLFFNLEVCQAHQQFVFVIIV